MWRRVGSVIEAVRGVGKSEEAGDGREGSEWRERGGVVSYLISRRGDTTLNFHISKLHINVKSYPEIYNKK